jgi:hypothetical protein
MFVAGWIFGLAVVGTVGCSSPTRPVHDPADGSLE